MLLFLFRLIVLQNFKAGSKIKKSKTKTCGLILKAIGRPCSPKSGPHSPLGSMCSRSKEHIGKAFLFTAQRKAGKDGARNIALGKEF